MREPAANHDGRHWPHHCPLSAPQQSSSGHFFLLFWQGRPFRGLIRFAKFPRDPVLIPSKATHCGQASLSGRRCPCSPASLNISSHFWSLGAASCGLNRGTCLLAFTKKSGSRVCNNVLLWNLSATNFLTWAFFSVHGRGE